MSENPVVAGMFLYEGFRDYINMTEPRGTVRIESRIGGAIEQAEACAHFAPLVARVTDEFGGDRDRPGVLAYEVWNPLGWWLAEQANAEDFTWPGEYEVEVHLLALLDQFFKQG